MSAEKIIQIANVTKRYHRGEEELTVLQNITFDVARGEFLALMGPSGSGKTTLLNLIAGLDSPDEGTVSVVGDVLNTLSERELARWRSAHVGIVFQFYNLIPVLTALENVALPLSLLEMSAAERKDRAAFVLQLVGLEDRMHHFPSQLSGGQEQRVAIARAIVTDPSLIVADEPTGDLDRHSAAEVLGLLRALNEQHDKTVLMVTHDPHAAGFAKRLLHLEKGELAG